MPVEQQRFWKWSQRQNGTYRPASVLKPEGPDTPISVRAAARHGRVLGVCERQRGGQPQMCSQAVSRPPCCLFFRLQFPPTDASLSFPFGPLCRASRRLR